MSNTDAGIVRRIIERLLPSKQVTIIDPTERELNGAIGRLMKSPTILFSNEKVSRRDADVRIVIDSCQRYMQLYHREVI